MARQPRIYYPGAIYHIIARGNNKDNVFYDASDKRKYLDLLGQYKQKYSIDLYAYVLMNNHCHLLMKANNHPPAKVMQGLQLSYTLYFNRRYERVGHIFQQRYKAFLCDNDAYLMQLVCYIHQNPVRAHLPGGVNYVWSSHKEYQHSRHGLVDTNYILSIFHQDRSQALNLYRERMGAPVQLEPANIREENEAFLADSRTEQVADMPEKPPCQFTLSQLADMIAAEYAVAVPDMMGHCRLHQVVQARNQLIFAAVKNGLASKIELARMLQLDPARITRAYQEVLNASELASRK